jgi:CRP-like cAMP-binding protein
MVSALRNLLLRTLDPSLLALLSPHLREVRLAGGVDIGGSGKHVYFPETLVAAPVDRPCGAEGGIALGLIGPEGVIGWSALLDAGAAPQRAVVQLAGGDALGMPTPTLLALCSVSTQLRATLLHFVGSFTVQMTRTIVTNMRDPLERRLARWITMLHDRVEGDVLPVTHSALADALAVRRASITDALHILEGEGVLRCTRALIHVRDRAKLEALAGDSYGPAEAAYSAAVAPFGKIAKAVLPTARAQSERMLVAVI